MSKQIVLNWLPPAKTYFPSPSMTVLKGALKKHGYECKIVYWNMLLEDIIRKYFLEIDPESLNDIDLLGIFFAAIALENKDEDALLKQILLLESLKPSYAEASFNFKSHIVDCVGQLNLRIQEIFDCHRFGDCLFCGFSMNLFQWVATSYIGRKLKELHPKTIQVIGGIGNSELAEVFLNSFPYFDVSLWGEGEESIVQLAQSLDLNGVICKNIISHGFVRNVSGVIESTTGKHKFWPLAECSSCDFDDFFSVYKGNTEQVSIPIESSRGCHWNRCKFCFLNQGYCYRVKSVEDLCLEIECLIDKYGIFNFSFMDNDVIGRDHKVFDNMLSSLQVIKSKFPDFSIKLAEISRC